MVYWCLDTVPSRLVIVLSCHPAQSLPDFESTAPSISVRRFEIPVLEYELAGIAPSVPESAKVQSPTTLESYPRTRVPQTKNRYSNSISEEGMRVRVAYARVLRVISWTLHDEG